MAKKLRIHGVTTKYAFGWGRAVCGMKRPARDCDVIGSPKIDCINCLRVIDKSIDQAMPMG